MVLGFGTVAGGSIVVSNRLPECEFDRQYYIGAYIFLSAGCITSAFCICAFFQIQQSTKTKDFYAFLSILMIIFVMQLSAAISSHILYTIASSGQLKKDMNVEEENYFQDDSSFKCINYIQSHFHCCGIFNFTDWHLLNKSAAVNMISSYPLSCQCQSPVDGCAEVVSSNSSNNMYVYSSSCYISVIENLGSTLLLIRIMGPSVLVVEIFILLIAVYLHHHIRNHSLVGVYTVNETETKSPAVEVNTEGGIDHYANLGNVNVK